MNNLGVFVAVILLLFSGIMFSQALSMNYYSEYGPGAGLLPLWVNGSIFILSLGYLIMAIKQDVILFSQVFPKGEGLINVLVYMGSALFFLIFVPYVGFLLGSIITLFIMFIRGYRWNWSLGLSIVLSLIIFWTFSTMLEVALPVNELGW